MRARGFTLVEVLVALVVVALGLAALSKAVSSTARSSGILREKMQAQWIALNRLAEVRLNLVKPGSSNDAIEVTYGNRTWHYDTRYFDTNVTTMKRIVIRVYAGETKAKGNPLNETVGFLSTALATPPGRSNMLDWRAGQTAPAPGSGAPGSGAAGGGLPTNGQPAGGPDPTNPSPKATPQPPPPPGPTPPGAHP